MTKPFRGVAILVFALAPAAFAEMPQSCAMLTPETIAKVLGIKVNAGKEFYSTSTTNSCGFYADQGTSAVSVAISSSPNQTSYFGSKNPRFREAKSFPGIGELAYIWPLKPSGGTIAILKHNVQLELSVNGVKGFTEAQLATLAKAAASKLP